MTWPCHTTFVTGVSPARHGVLGNHVLDRTSGAPISHHGHRTDVPVRAETLWDRAAAAGLRAAAVCWPKTRGASRLPDRIPEFYERRTRPGRCGPSSATRVSPSTGTVPWSEAHALAPLQDWLSLEVATWLLRHRPPDLLLLHFLVADSFQHDHGPQSPEAAWALEYADGLLGRFLDVLDETGRRDLTNVLVVGDHGFVEVQDVALPNAALHAAGVLRLDTAGRVLGYDARVVANGGAAHVYVAPGPHRDATLGRLHEVLEDTPGVGAVLGPEVYADLGLPDPADDATQGDLMLTAADGWQFADHTTPEAAARAPWYRGSHGHLPDDPRLLAGFAAAGPDIAEGCKLDEISHLDVAPTVAALLGLVLPAAERPPLPALATR